MQQLRLRLVPHNLLPPAGQEPLRELEAGLKAKNASVWCIGGADVATELDAKRAIDQGRLIPFDCRVTHFRIPY
jgi:hypothetical protein